MCLEYWTPAYSPYDGVECLCEDNKDFGVEESEVVETVLPANHRTHHEQSGTAQQDEGQQQDDLGMGGRGRVGRKRQLYATHITRALLQVYYRGLTRL